MSGDPRKTITLGRDRICRTPVLHFIKFLNTSETFRDEFFQIQRGGNMGNHTMSVSGKIIREVAEDIFEVKTRLGTALIWFDEELYLKPVVG